MDEPLSNITVGAAIQPSTTITSTRRWTLMGEDADAANLDRRRSAKKAKTPHVQAASSINPRSGEPQTQRKNTLRSSLQTPCRREAKSAVKSNWGQIASTKAPLVVVSQIRRKIPNSAT